MTVFKYFFKVMKEYKWTIVLYTVLLVGFAGFNLQTSDNSTNFMASKPDVLVIDNDESKLSKNLESYLKENANLKELENNEEKINDALFYRDVSLIIEIPKGYSNGIINNDKKDIIIKSTGDKEAEYGKMLLERYLKISNVYENIKNEDLIINKINKQLESSVQVTIKSKLNTTELDKMAFFYNFANYSLLAGCVFVISTVLNSFKTNLIILTSINLFSYTIIRVPLEHLYNYLEIKFMSDISKDLYHKIDNLPCIAFEEIGVGEFINRLYNDIDRIMELLKKLIKILKFLLIN